MLDVVIQPHAIRIGPRLQVSFQRTLRSPDDGRTYPLPPGLGVFPVFKVADHRATVPADWGEDDDGAFIPMYQRETLWLGFDAAAWKPNAVHTQGVQRDAASRTATDAQGAEHGTRCGRSHAPEDLC